MKLDRKVTVFILLLLIISVFKNINANIQICKLKAQVEDIQSTCRMYEDELMEIYTVGGEESVNSSKCQN